jgi:hypothetical protein
LQEIDNLKIRTLNKEQNDPVKVELPL